MRRIAFLFVLLLTCISLHAAVTDEVTTIVQAGHYITDFEISVNEKYMVTTDRSSIALWDLKKRRIIRRIPVAGAYGIRCHQTKPNIVYAIDFHEWLSISPSKYHVYDMFTGKELGRQDASTFGPIKRSTSKARFILKDGKITVKPRSGLKIPTIIDGGASSLAGGLDIYGKDSLLLVNGLEPRVWDLHNGRLVTRLPLYDFIEKASGEYMTLRGLHAYPYLTSLKPSNENIPYGYRNHCEGQFVANGNVFIGSYIPCITYWDLGGNLLSAIPVDAATVFSFNGKGSRIAAGTCNGLLYGDTNKEINEVPICTEKSKNSVYHVTEPDTDGYFYFAKESGIIGRGNINKLDYYEKVVDLGHTATSVRTSPDCSRLLASGEFGSLAEIDPATNEKFLYDTHEFNSARVDACEYLPGGMIAATSDDCQIGFWRRGQKECVKILQQSYAPILDIKVGADSTRFYTSDKEGTVVIWDSATQEPLLSIYPIGDDYLFITPENYYMGSRGIHRNVHFSRGLDVYGFDQFDLKFNRPDKIMQLLGADPLQVEMLHKSYLKRLRRMGFTEDMLSDELHTPTVTISKKEIPDVTDETMLTLDINASDSKYKLSKLMVSLNGVPLGSAQGTDISKLNLSEYSVQIPIEIAAGTNIVQVSCYNDKGVESYAEEIEIFCKKPERKPRLLLAAVGVSQFDQKDFNLTYAAKDAKDLISLIKSLGADTYSDIQTMLLTDAEVSSQSLAKLHDFFNRSERDDVAILFYAGHGLLDSDMNYYLATSATDFSNPASGSWAYEDFESTLDGIPALKKFCLIDACHSGEIDKEEYLADNSVAMAEGSLVFRSAGSGIRSNGVGSDRVNTLFKEMFIDLRRCNGASVLSSAEGVEVALEGADWQNGLFTWAIKDALTDFHADSDADGNVTIEELARYVSNRVNTLSAGRQNPGMRMENRMSNTVLLSKP